MRQMTKRHTKNSFVVYLPRLQWIRRSFWGGRAVEAGDSGDTGPDFEGFGDVFPFWGGEIAGRRPQWCSGLWWWTVRVWRWIWLHCHSGRGGERCWWWPAEGSGGGRGMRWRGRCNNQPNSEGELAGRLGGAICVDNCLNRWDVGRAMEVIPLAGTEISSRKGCGHWCLSRTSECHKLPLFRLTNYINI